MSVNKLGKFAVIGLSAAWIAGCSTTSTDTDSSTTVAEDANSAANTDSAYGAGQDNATTSVIVEEKIQAWILWQV